MGSPEVLSSSPSPREASDSDDRRFAWTVCKNYLQGAWQEIGEEEVDIKRVSGGLSNHIFFVTLPEGVTPHSSEPSEVLLRIYGSLSAEDEDSRHGISKTTAFNVVQDSVIFSLLSERGLGPKLLGTFPEGRLEELIPARSMTAEEVRDSRLSAMIARQMAKIHRLSMPISREGPWIERILSKYHKQVAATRLEGVADEYKEMAKPLLNFDWKTELEWLTTFLSRVNSPIVFCHNDVQGGNILLKRDDNNDFSELMLIDYEFCGYNNRAFDIANHLSEWVYDYTHQDWPYFSCQKENFPSKERQMEFLRAYQSEQTCPSSLNATQPIAPLSASSSTAPPASSARRPARRRNLSCDQKSEILYQEVQAFILAAHLLWCMWGVAQSTNRKIPFGYWEYATARLTDYQSHKSKILEQEEFIAGMKRSSR